MATVEDIAAIVDCAVESRRIASQRTVDPVEDVVDVPIIAGTHSFQKSHDRGIDP